MKKGIITIKYFHLPIIFAIIGFLFSCKNNVEKVADSDNKLLREHQKCVLEALSAQGVNQIKEGVSSLKLDSINEFVSNMNRAKEELTKEGVLDSVSFIGNMARYNSLNTCKSGVYVIVNGSVRVHDHDPGFWDEDEEKQFTFERREFFVQDGSLPQQNQLYPYFEISPYISYITNPIQPPLTDFCVDEEVNFKSRFDIQIKVDGAQVIGYYQLFEGHSCNGKESSIKYTYDTTFPYPTMSKKVFINAKYGGNWAKGVLYITCFRACKY